jgi:hypothetical protein
MSTTPQSYSLKQLPLYGRKYQIQVLMPPDSSGEQTVLTVADNSFEPEAMRVTFDIQSQFFQNIWYADVVIYNIDQAFETQMISGVTQGVVKDGDPAAGVPVQQGMKVIVSAGYQNGNYGKIWEGDVFQALFERESVTDNKITLHCVIGLDLLYRGLVNISWGDSNTPVDQTSLLLKIAQSAFIPIAQTNTSSMAISKNISKQKSSRTDVIFGTPAEHFTQAAEENNMQWFMSPQGFNLARLDDASIVSTQPPLIYSPLQFPYPGAQPLPVDADTIPGLIGTPVQTQDGADFRVLLNPNIHITFPAVTVQLNMTSVSQMKKQIGQPPYILDEGATYIVYAVRHIGDTRGNAWYTDVRGLLSVGGKMGMANTIKAILNGSGA